MRFPQKFPYTTINNINLDWIIKKVKEALRVANEAADDVSGAIEAAAAAEASAESAQAAAEAAESAAQGVVDTAQEALTTAQAAQTTAEGIAGTASQALTTAQAAQTTANSANTTAQAAQTTAEGVAGTASQALTTAQAAQTTAEDAQETAEGVAGTASQALTTAQTAQTTANSANTAAQAAQTTANSKCEIHDNAITTLATWSSQKIRNEIDSARPGGLVSYAEAQTLTEAQKKQAKKNIGANWTLLWENASPTSQFAAQSIAVNLSGYDTIKILVKSSYTGTAALYYDIPNTIGAYVITSIYGGIESSGAVTLYNRRLTITSSGFDVVDAVGKALTTTSAPPVANTVCIPWMIYGGNLL